MKKALCITLAILLVLLLSCALLVGCTDKQEGSTQPTSDEKQQSGENANLQEEQLRYYDNMVHVVLTHQASIDSLSLESLLELDFGDDIIDVIAPNIFKDNEIKEMIQRGEMNNTRVLSYTRYLQLVLSRHDMELFI